ncbi:MAG: hypothetical protein ABIK62_03155 [candidate division WOR-3 bacterium]
MKRCGVCGRRRGGRDCPVLGGICSLCCGAKRRRGVECPDDCRYLNVARQELEQRRPEFASLRRVRDIDPEFADALEESIRDVREDRFQDLRDREVKESLENVYRTLKTEEKGVIYEYRSPDPRIQIVADAVSHTIARYREGRETSHQIEPIAAQACVLAALHVLRATTRREPAWQARIARDLGMLPASITALNDPVVTDDPALAAAATYARSAPGIPPTRPIRCAWDAVEIELPSLLLGRRTAADTAAAMQRRAMACAER